MRLPYTNQINQQLPVFPCHSLTLTSIKLHQVYVGNRGDLRAPPNQCQTGSRILQIRIRLDLNYVKLSSSCTMVLQCLPWCTKIHWSKSTPNGFHHDSSCMYQRWWCTALASPSFKLHALWIVPTARKKKTQLCLRCCHCWKSLKPFSSVMATDSSPSLLHDFLKTIRYKIREQLLIRAVQVWSEDTVTTITALSDQLLDCKLEATAEPLPNNAAPEPKSPPPSILHSVMSNIVKPYLRKMSQICTAVGANQQSSKAFT